jgi:three-Cys-motif partner protein
MSAQKRLKLDRIGYWSEIKLDIIREYAKAYSTILSAQRSPSLSHVYIDAFAGAGVHLRKKTEDEVQGSPQIAVNTKPPFREYHFIDLDGDKVENLQTMFRGQSNVRIHRGDCNSILRDVVFTQVKFDQYRRGLCLLDPYGLQLNWEVIELAGRMRSIELFLNFPIMDMNRNVFWRNPEGVASSDINRMNAFWGDDSWRTIAYKKVPNLFGEDEEKTDNETIAQAFRERLRKQAGFSSVPEPLPMCNNNGAIVYYLFFASPKPLVPGKIVNDIFAKYRDRGVT